MIFGGMDPSWLKSIHLIRPKPEESNRAEELNDEEREICLTSLVHVVEPIICLERYSSYTRLKRITAWCLRFINNCLAKLSKANRILLTSSLTSLELHISEVYWIRLAQRDNFESEIACLQLTSPYRYLVLYLHFIHFLTKTKCCVQVVDRNAQSYLTQNVIPFILHAKHPIAKLLIWSEHQRLLHGGPTLALASLSYRFHLLNCRKTVRSVLRQCITCRRQANHKCWVNFLLKGLIQTLFLIK